MRAAQRVRHPLRLRVLEVHRVDRVTPHLVRVTLGGADLDGFTSPGFDDHVKLFFPDPQAGELLLPTVGADGAPVFSEGARPIARDYTPRRHDAVRLTLEIDFAIHEAGPATQWVLQAAPGQRLGVGGRRGSFLLPTAFDGHLLIGDDTALPAIARRLAELPAGAPAVVLAEVEGPEDELKFDTQAALQVRWVHRQGAEPGAPGGLLKALQTLPVPKGDYHAWIACETRVAQALRRQLLAAHGANAAWMKAAGYWRRGSAATHDKIED
ncbi:siderophore-interacting protein [Aquincola sp. MAHUQ-54]|uniref:Siderophore-interacting protein n=1 Tax=Aquincola agrisoli TaxID=3119538 RepID=A0AAW9Q6E3_9BURK